MKMGSMVSPPLTKDTTFRDQQTKIINFKKTNWLIELLKQSLVLCGELFIIGLCCLEFLQLGANLAS